jgi:hypothetical protein
MLEFQVVDVKSKPILGLMACQKLDLIQRIDVVQDATLTQFADVFQGLGNMEDTYTIRTDSSIQPVIHAPRKVPAALRDQLMKELQRMEAEKVIEKVDHPTDWVSSLVIVEKHGGGLRICLDPRDLNKPSSVSITNYQPLKRLQAGFVVAQCSVSWMQTQRFGKSD